MTSKTDMQVLGELGWTMQVILNQSGLVPSFWRPPYGDIDNRVRAIAKEVFGLYSVLWNQVRTSVNLGIELMRCDKDTFDWCLKEGGGSSCVGFGPLTDAGLDAELQKFYTGPKSRQSLNTIFEPPADAPYSGTDHPGARADLPVGGWVHAQLPLAPLERMDSQAHP